MTEPLAPTTIGERQAIAEAATELLERMSSTYKARNGREMGIQGDDGEKCYIVHSDEIEALRRALATPTTNAPVAAQRVAPKAYPQMNDAERGRWLVKQCLQRIDTMKPQNMGFGWPLIRNFAEAYIKGGDA